MRDILAMTFDRKNTWTVYTNLQSAGLHPTSLIFKGIIFRWLPKGPFLWILRLHEPLPTTVTVKQPSWSMQRLLDGLVDAKSCLKHEEPYNVLWIFSQQKYGSFWRDVFLRSLKLLVVDEGSWKFSGWWWNIANRDLHRRKLWTLVPLWAMAKHGCDHHQSLPIVIDYPSCPNELAMVSQRHDNHLHQE